MRYICISFFVLLFSGCVTTKVPSKSEYRINTTVITTKNDAQNCKEKSIKVAQAFSSSSLMSNSMTYALGNSKQYVYSQSLWAQTPNSVITSKFLKLIRGTELFKSVQISKSRSNNDFLLEINIEDFMQYFDEKSTSSYANVSLSLTVIEITSNKVIATKTFTSKVEIDTLNAEGGVDGLSESLNNILANTNIWLNGVCK
ncbi:MAG: cholesterol transport system auxiliary component [Sulfurimonas sp.]|uniref:ABC-type transport auxiliary lipoprotein family protein n=1 Tax=Sulfurimonas sp. TaxID=2022749 RepID=UPI0039E6CF3E